MDTLQDSVFLTPASQPRSLNCEEVIVFDLCEHRDTMNKAAPIVLSHSKRYRKKTMEQLYFHSLARLTVELCRIQCDFRVVPIFL